MQFNELAVQGVRGFSASARISFRPGYQCLSSPTERTAPLASVIGSLAFPTGRGDDVGLLEPGANFGRVGFSLETSKQQAWRLVRDLGGAGALFRFEVASNQFEPLTRESAEIAQTLRAQAGFLTQAAFFELFVLDKKHLPSVRPVHSKSFSASPAGGVDSVVVSHAIDEDARLARVSALKAELSLSKALTELQFRADTLQAELFQAEARAEDRRLLALKVSDLQHELATAPSPSQLGLPDDIVERVKRVGADRKRRDEALNKLVSEREQAGVVQLRQAAAWYRNQQLLFALALGAAALVVPLFLAVPLRPVALLAIPCFGFAALLLLQHIELLQSIGRQAAKAEVFENREQRIKEEFGQIESLVQLAFDKVSATTSDEFFAAFARKEQLVPLVAQAEIDLAEFDADLQNAERISSATSIRAEQETVAAQIAQQGQGYAREQREIERDLQELQPRHTPPQGMANPTEVTAPARVAVDPFPALFKLAGELFLTDLLTLWSQLKDRVTQYVHALTDRRIQALNVDVNGRVVLTVDAHPLAVLALDAKDVDLVYLALRLTLVEKYTVQNKFPLIVDHQLFGALEPAKQELALRMVRHLGSQTQVLHVVPSHLADSQSIAL